MTVQYIVFSNEKIGKKELETLSQYAGLLSAKESKRFIEYLQAPFFNADGHLAPLFTYLLTASDRASERINAEPLFKKLGKRLVARDLIQCVRTLTAHLKDFLVLLQTEKDKRLYLSALNASVRNKGQGALVAELAEKRRKELDKQALDLSVLVEDWWIDHQYYYEIDTDREASGQDYLAVLYHKLEDMYAAAKIMYDCEDLHLKRAAHQTTPAAKPVAKGVVLTKLYQLHKALAEAPVEEAGQQLEAFSLAFNEATRHKTISALNARALLKYTVNSLSSLVNNGRSEYLEPLYHWLLRAEEFRPEQILRMQSSEMLNIVNVGCSLGRFDEVLDYIERHRDHLPAQTRQLDEGIAKLYVMFAQGKYADALTVLDAEFGRRIATHVSYNLRVKTLKLKVATELVLEGYPNGEDVFYRVAEDLKKYLTRNKGIHSEDILLRNRNFLHLTQKLKGLMDEFPASKRNNEKYEAFLVTIAHTAPLIARDWLVKKTEQHILR